MIMIIFFLTVISIACIIYSMYKNNKSKINISVFGISEIAITIIIFIFYVIANKIVLFNDFNIATTSSNIFDDIASLFAYSENNMINKYTFAIIQEVVLLLVIIIEFYKLYKIGKVFNQHGRKKCESFIPCYNYYIECKIKNVKFNFLIPILINITMLLLIILYVLHMLILFT